MNISYDGAKLQEALAVLEDEITKIERKAQKKLRQKEERDEKRKEQQEIVQKLGEGKRLVKQATGIERLISYAGIDCSVSSVYKAQVAGLEEECAGLEQDLKSYVGKGKAFAEAAELDECLQVYRKLCNQPWLINTNDGEGQEELNRFAKVYFQRTDALGIGSRMLGLSQGMQAAKMLKTDEETFIRMPEYIEATTEMLAEYLNSHKLAPQGKDRLNNMLATFYIWLTLLEYDRMTAQSYFQRLSSLDIRWNKEECPAVYFEGFYELKRQNKATLTIFGMKGYWDSDETLLYYTGADRVKAYLDNIVRGEEHYDEEFVGMAKQILKIYTSRNCDKNADMTCSHIQETMSKLEVFRGQPFFEEIEDVISAAIKDYYDHDDFRNRSKERYSRYLENWIRDNKERYSFQISSFSLKQKYPWDDLEKEIENCKSKQVILKLDDLVRQVFERENIKKRLKALRRIEKSEGRKKTIIKPTKYEGKISLPSMLVAVLVPLNIISLFVFEFIVAVRDFIVSFGTDDGSGAHDRKKVWIKQVNGRLNLIVTVSMCLFYFTGGYSVLDFSYNSDMIAWLSSKLSFGGEINLIIVILFGVLVLTPYFAWTVWKDLLELRKGIHKK